MRLFLISLFFIPLALFSSSIVAEEEFNIRICEGCSEAQMANDAGSIDTNKRRTTVHVLDPINNKVEAYIVIKTSEPGFQSTDVFKTEPSQEIVEATSQAHSILKSTRAEDLARADRLVVEEIFDLYPAQIPNHVKVIRLGSDTMSSAHLIKEDGYPAILSKEIEDALGLAFHTTVFKTVVVTIMSQYKSFAVIVFDDGSMLVATLGRSHSSFRWDAVFYVDSNGVARDATGKRIGDSSSSGGSGGTTNTNGGTWTVFTRDGGVEWCFVSSKGVVESCWFETSAH